MKKIALILAGILMVVFTIFRWADLFAPYIQFENEIFTSSEVTNYRDVEITIKDIYYANEYTYQADILKYDEYGNETHLTEETLYPKNGNEYMFVDIEVKNNTEKNFNISGMCWMARIDEKTYGEISKDEKNRFSYVVEPDAKDVNTLLFEIPKDQKDVELIYYDNINKKPSNRRPFNKAPNFVIKLEKENND